MPPFQTNGKRDYKKEANWEKKTHPERIKQRLERNKARYDAEAAGQVHKGDHKQVDHIKPLSQGGSNAESNRRVISAHANESYPRNPDGSIKRTGRRGRG